MNAAPPETTTRPTCPPSTLPRPRAECAWLGVLLRPRDSGARRAFGAEAVQHDWRDVENRQLANLLPLPYGAAARRKHSLRPMRAGRLVAHHDRRLAGQDRYQAA